MAAPTALAVTSESATAVALSWTAAAGASSYKIQRATPTSAGIWGAWTNINAGSVTGTTYTDNAANSNPDPTAGGIYLYAVSAVISGVESPFSNAVAAIFAAAVTRIEGDQEDDIGDLFDADDFGDEASYTRYGYSAVNIMGMFDDEAENPEPLTGEMRASKPMFTCATSDVASASNRDKLSISGVLFRVLSVKPDGSGITVLELTRG